jgi:hypothetical protein
MSRWRSFVTASKKTSAGAGKNQTTRRKRSQDFIRVKLKTVRIKKRGVPAIPKY